MKNFKYGGTDKATFLLWLLSKILWGVLLAVFVGLTVLGILVTIGVTW